MRRLCSKISRCNYIGDGGGASVTAEQERWAEASAILKWQGERADAWLARRIAALAAVDDVVGVERMRAIAARLRRLVEASSA